MLSKLRKTSDEMILAEALIYFVVIGTVALVATIASHLF
jgi:hypothetical protein